MCTARTEKSIPPYEYIAYLTALLTTHVTANLFLTSSNPDHSKHNHDSNSNTNNDNGDDDDKKDSDKTKSHTIKHSKSLKVEKIKHALNNLKSEGHHKNLNKYIHNVVKERIDRMTERLLE